MQGLSESEAARRYKAGDGNNGRPRAGRSYAAIIWQATFVPVNLVLFAVSAVLVVLGLPIDAALTAGPVAMNIAVSATMEASAKWRLDRLRILTAHKTTVIREGRERPIDPASLVRGDLIVVSRGDEIVLDGELVEGEVEVDESLLTGEGDPLVRRERQALLSGSVCVSGRGVMRVTRVGLESYANQLTAQAQSMRTERTPLQRGVDRLIAMIAVLVVVDSLAVALSSSFGAGQSTVEIAQAAAVLVALVPQGLAILITLTYATAALRISRAGALVQRVNSVESMSRVDTLVLDKTGTLTAPHFELREILPIGVDRATLVRLVEAVAGSMPQGDHVGDALRQWVASADPPAAGAANGELGPARPTVLQDAVPFSSSRRWSGIVEADTNEAVVIGAPEAVLSPSAQPGLTETVERWTNSGLRVVVLTRGGATSLRDASGQPALPPALSPVAAFGFAEEIRPDAAETLRAFQSAGVAVKVVSGDNPRTVAHVAQDVGLEGADRAAVNGPDLAGVEESTLGPLVERATVVGRVEPSLKARIVRALRAQGRYVGVVGDGVNDILALKSANLGVAMESGSSATRAVADLVLLGDRFAVLPQVVAEGRRIINGMLGSAALLLTRTFYMLLIVLGAAIARSRVPVHAAQQLAARSRHRRVARPGGRGVGTSGPVAERLRPRDAPLLGAGRDRGDRRRAAGLRVVPGTRRISRHRPLGARHDHDVLRHAAHPDPGPVARHRRPDGLRSGQARLAPDAPGCGDGRPVRRDHGASDRALVLRNRAHSARRRRCSRADLAGLGARRLRGAPPRGRGPDRGCPSGARRLTQARPEAGGRSGPAAGTRRASGSSGIRDVAEESA